MKRSAALLRQAALTVCVVALALLALNANALAAKSFNGKWLFTVTMPVAPGSGEKVIFTINLEASPRGQSLHGKAMITDFAGQTVPGVWRQSGKKVSLTLELPCTENLPCATLILKGKMKQNALFKKGDVIVMWDTENERNPALYDTSNGSFTGTRIE